MNNVYKEYANYVYGNVPREDMFSELQGGKMYDIDIGRVERMPRLEGTGIPTLNVAEQYANSEVERLKKELEEAKAGKTSGAAADMGGGGGGGGGDGTAGGLGDTAGGGGYGSSSGNADSAAGSPAGDGGGVMAARGGSIGNNAIHNALRLIKADRR
jgi:hypothetical protein